jgi:hypothetical protein
LPAAVINVNVNVLFDIVLKLYYTFLYNRKASEIKTITDSITPNKININKVKEFLILCVTKNPDLMPFYLSNFVKSPAFKRVLKIIL